MSRLFAKLFLALWLSIMGFAVIMSAINDYLQDRSFPLDVEQRYSTEIDAIQQRLTSALNRQGPQAARQILRNLPRRIEGRVFLFDDNGEEILGRNRSRDRIRDSDIQRVAREIVTATGESWNLVILRRAPPRAVLEPGRRGAMLRLMIAAVVSALVSFLLARYLTRPLDELGRASRRLARGELASRIGPPLTKRRDEFGGLALDFDDMAERLQQLQAANRRLLRDVSHELRSPLARLSVALEIARNRNCEPVAGELDRIQLEADRLESLINEVLDLLRESSETRPLSTEEIDLAELVRELVDVVQYEVPDGGPGLKVECPETFLIRGNRELIWRSLENLVRNALLHSRGESGVEVVVSGPDEDSMALVRVLDRGPGLAEQHLQKIFEPFYRVQEARDRKTGGHGLGLAIAAASVRRHGGELTALNREGGGLEMRVRLPA